MKKKYCAFICLTFAFLLLAACSAQDIHEGIELTPEYISDDGLLISLDAGDGHDILVKIWYLENEEWGLLNTAAVSVSGQDQVSLSFGRSFKGLTVTTDSSGGCSFSCNYDPANELENSAMQVCTVKEPITAAAGEDIPIVIQLFGKGTAEVEVSPDVFDSPEILPDCEASYMLTLCIKE